MLPNFNMLFQLVLTKFFKSELFLCLPKVDHVIAVMQRLRQKSRFAFFQTFSRLLQVAYFVKCRQTHRGKKFVFVCLRPPNKT